MKTVTATQSAARNRQLAVRGLGFRFRLAAYCLLLAAQCLVFSCSIPNLEETECREARDNVREFYSFHFGNDMHPTEENVRIREKYLSREMIITAHNAVSGSSAITTEPFTAMPTDDLPKAFRAGECTVLEPGQNVRFDILLFWKDNARSEQKHVSASLKKENDKWLIDSVSPLDK